MGFQPRPSSGNSRTAVPRPLACPLRDGAGLQSGGTFKGLRRRSGPAWAGSPCHIHDRIPEPRCGDVENFVLGEFRAPPRRDGDPNHRDMRRIVFMRSSWQRSRNLEPGRLKQGTVAGLCISNPLKGIKESTRFNNPNPVPNSARSDLFAVGLVENGFHLFLDFGVKGFVGLEHILGGVASLGNLSAPEADPRTAFLEDLMLQGKVEE